MRPEISVTLVPVPLADKPALKAMLDPYLVEHADVADPERRYGDPARYPYFDVYWTEPERTPLWILAEGERVGFVLVNAHSPSGRGTDRTIAEFFVLPAWRRRGAGAAAARAALQSRPGQWELQVYKTNPAGMAFWPRAIAAAGARDWERLDLGEPVVHRFRMG
ncbi:MAG TPA: GNAT family N-acetyltransferase [Caulobacteraceae bacterium]|nr:GNAT family N-acetyltransferase [Caulobacteraceae bacterium]